MDKYHEQQKRIEEHDSRINELREKGLLKSPFMDSVEFFDSHGYLSENGSLLPNKYTAFPPYEDSPWSDV